MGWTINNLCLNHDNNLCYICPLQEQKGYKSVLKSTKMCIILQRYIDMISIKLQTFVKNKVWTTQKLLGRT
jgi:hypothetical protein